MENKIRKTINQVPVPEDLEERIIRHVKSTYVLNAINEKDRPNRIRRMKMINRKRSKNRKIITISVAAACLVMLCCTPVFAEGIRKLWNDIVAKMYDADENVQVQYENTDLIQTFSPEENRNENTDEKVKAECNGVTVTVAQTMADDYGICIFVNVKDDGKEKLSDNHLFESTQLYVDGKIWDGFDNFGGGFVEDIYAKSDYERIYELRYLNSEGIDLVGKDVTLRLSNLQADAGKLEMYTAVEGTWELQWNVSGKYVGEKKFIDLKNTQITDYILKNIEITPISFTLNYEYTGNDPNNLDSINVAFLMKDGTIYNNENAPESTEWITGAGVFGPDYARRTLEKILNLDELDAVRICGIDFVVDME